MKDVKIITNIKQTLLPEGMTVAGFLRNLLYLALGSFLAGIAVNVFFIPINITTGGVTGIATIAYQLTGRGELLSLGTLIMLFNIPLLLLGLFKVGFHFIWRSIVGTFVYSFMIDLTYSMTAGWYGEFLNRKLAGGMTPDPLILCLFSGLLFGIGLGLVIKGGYTTGGTDILAVVIHRKFKSISIGKILMALDVVIVSASAIVFIHLPEPSILMALYSFVALYITSVVADMTIEGLERSRAVYIICKHPEEMAEHIFAGLDRGATLLFGKGMYSGERRDVVMCVVSSRQVPKLKKLVSKVDKEAFVFLIEAREVQGFGFEKDSVDFLG